MPSTTVIAPRRTQQVVIRVKGGGSRQIPIAPSQFDSEGSIRLAMIDRPGRTQLTRPDGPDNKRLRFEHQLAMPNWTQSVQGTMNWLDDLRRKRKSIRFTGMPKQFGGVVAHP